MSWGDRRRLAPSSWLPSFGDKKAWDLQSRVSTTRSSMDCLAGCSIHISESNEQTAQSCGGRSKLLKLSSLITDRWSIGNRVMITTYWGPTLDKLSTPLESNLWWIIVGSKSANQQQQQQCTVPDILGKLRQNARWHFSCHKKFTKIIIFFPFGLTYIYRSNAYDS